MRSPSNCSLSKKSAHLKVLPLKKSALPRVLAPGKVLSPKCSPHKKCSPESALLKKSALLKVLFLPKVLSLKCSPCKKCSPQSALPSKTCSTKVLSSCFIKRRALDAIVGSGIHYT